MTEQGGGWEPAPLVEWPADEQRRHDFLLADGDLLDRVLERPVSGTDAACAFLEVNFEHPEFGLCSSLVRRAYGPAVTADPSCDRFVAVPWAKLPDVRQRLERGEVVSYLPRRSDEALRTLYEGTPVLSEVNARVLSGGRWVGVLGLSDAQERTWADEEAELLTAARVLELHVERGRMLDRLLGGGPVG